MARLTVALLVTLVLAGPAATLAQDATPAASPAATDLAYPPDAEVEGLTLAEWHGRFQGWFLTFPIPIHPALDDTGERCAYAQQGPVFYLPTSLVPELEVTRACTVPADAPLLVLLLGVGCSTVEPPPFFGRDEAELRACAAGVLDADEPNEQSLTVDGVEIPLDGYRTQSPLLRVALPPDNLLGVPPTVTDAVSDAYAVLLRPLPVGEHTVKIGVPGPEGRTATLTYTLTVAAAEVNAPPEGTPSAGTPVA